MDRWCEIVWLMEVWKRVYLYVSYVEKWKDSLTKVTDIAHRAIKFLGS